MALPAEFTSNTETKPGVYTTEFWATVFANSLGTFELVFGGLNVQNEFVLIALAVINGAYSASRGLAKKEQPYLPEVVEAEIAQRYADQAEPEDAEV